ASILTDFGTSGGDIACIEDLPINAIKIAPRLVRRMARQKGQSVAADVISNTIGYVRETGVSVIVDGIETAEQLAWWRHAGADIAQGRSEEHTSELQSRENLVCRLLLEKK